MAVCTIFAHSVRKKYRTNLCSKSAVFAFVVTLFTVVVPFVLSYKGFGFWKKIDKYQEQPHVRFKRKMLLILETDKTPIYWSSYPFLNDHVSGVRVPHIEEKEDDANFDGKPDILHLMIKVPLPGNTKVFAAKLLLLFDCSIQTYAQVAYEGIGLVQHSSGVPGDEFMFTGDLRLKQQNLFNYHGYDHRNKKSIINEETTTVSGFSSERLLHDYSSRNVTTNLENIFSTWRSTKKSPDFTLNIKIRYPVETIFYRPGFWHVVQHAWMQYFAILVIFLYIGHSVKCFVFSNQVLETYYETVVP
ncbi:transmembrane protein 231-like [Ornithodoros turicata]